MAGGLPPQLVDETRRALDAVVSMTLPAERWDAVGYAFAGRGRRPRRKRRSVLALDAGDVDSGRAFGVEHQRTANLSGDTVSV